MGKKTRRKQRHANKSKPHGVQQEEQGGKNAADATNTSAVLLKIRHSDPRTRHGALAALLHCQFHPSVLSSSKKQISTMLLQAIREQVVNHDIHCASAAAACLANYVAFQQTDKNAADNDLLTAGWLIILVKRLKQDCIVQIQQPQPQPQQLLMWMELTEKCVTCVVHLLESNPVAMQRLLNDDQLRSDCIEVLTELIRIYSNSPETTTTADANAAMETETTKESEKQKKNKKHLEGQKHVLQSSILTLSCRCFHSSWDDNKELVVPWVLHSLESAKQTMEVLHMMITSSTANVTVAKLHATGAWIAAWLVIQNYTRQNEDIDTVVKDFCTVLYSHMTSNLSLLQQTLQNWQSQGDKVEYLVKAFKAHQEQEDDDALEKQVVNAVNEKGESARSIARRHKQKQQDKKKQQEAMDEDEKEDEKKSGKLRTERDDCGQGWEDALRKWQDESIRPVQLALEIIANLTTTTTLQPYNDEEMDFDGDMMMDDQEVEPNATLDPEVIQLLCKTNIPDAVFHLFAKLLLTSSWQTTTPEISSIPDAVCESGSDLQSKSAVCLSHCLANISDWQTPPELWNGLVQGVFSVGTDTSTYFFWDDEARQAVCSVAVVTFQSPARQTGITSQPPAKIAQDIDMLLTFLTSKSHSSSPTIVRDIVCLIGMLLCNSPKEIQSAPEVNHKVSQSLLSLLNTLNTKKDPKVAEAVEPMTSAMITSEALNVLMDMYGEDDAHPDIFQSLDCLGYFQRTLPELKRNIAECKRTKCCEDEDIGQWKETAMNASRFIQYKKGH